MPPTETLRVIHLDRFRRVLDVAEYESGHRSAVAIPTRSILADILRLDSAGLILSHNHPCGDPSPSEADIAATRILANIGGAIGVKVHDHVIRGRGGGISFRALGLL